jgi:hypothetical protein
MTRETGRRDQEAIHRSAEPSSGAAPLAVAFRANATDPAGEALLREGHGVVSER